MANPLLDRVAGTRDETVARVRALLERRKALELAHANQRAGQWPGPLALRLLRAHLRGWLHRPAAVEPRTTSTPTSDDTLVIQACGHATFQVVSARGRVLTDPFLGSWLHAQRRRIAPALHPDDLRRTSAALLSCAGRDHLHPPSLRRLPPGTQALVPAALARRVERACPQVEVVGLTPEDRVRIEDLEITALPVCRADDPRGTRSLAYLVEAPSVTAYFAGATGYFSGFTDLGQRARPDVALLPIAGYAPATARASNLSPLDALYAAQDLGARILIPFGFDALTLGWEPPGHALAWLERAARELGLLDRVHVLWPSQSLRVTRPTTGTPAPAVHDPADLKSAGSSP